MEPEGFGADLIDSMQIPVSEHNLYNQACEDDRIAARSLSIAPNRTSATLLVQGRGREMIARIEKLYSVRIHLLSIIVDLLTIFQGSKLRRERQLEHRGIKPAIQVYFPGETQVGPPYMAIIPFYISGNVMLGDCAVQMGWHYHVYGECRLSVQNQHGVDGKLGAWVYMLGN